MSLHALLHEVPDVVLNDLYRFVINCSCSNVMDTAQAAVKGIRAVHVDARSEELSTLSQIVFWA